MRSGPEVVAGWLKTAADQFASSVEALDDLDAAIGDGDHGTNMARGFATAMILSPEDSVTPGQYLNQVGMALVSSVGGASGPLYGTFFLRVGRNWQTPYSIVSVYEALCAGRDGIMSRGRAAVGDKTMLDALCPAIDSLEAAMMAGETDLGTALNTAVEAAHNGAQATASMLARRGRAAHFGQRSIGHVDPGAASMAILLEGAARHLG